MLNWLFTQTPLLFLTQSLWRDEAFSYFLAKKNIFEIIILSAKDFTPPLYQLVLHFWIKIFGSSEIALRSLSLIFYWTTLYICYDFMKDIFKLNRNKSVFYFLIFLFNPFLTYYAFEARAYSMLAFFATLSYYTFYRKNNKLYLFSAILGLYTHYFMLFVILSQFMFTKIVVILNGSASRQRSEESSKALLIRPLLFFLPWIIFVLFVKTFSGSFWIDRTNLQTFINLPGITFTGFERNLLLPSLFISLIILIAFLKIKKNKIKQDLFFYLLIWSIGIPLLVGILSLFKSVFYPRYFIFSTVGLILLLVYCLENIKQRARLILYFLLLIISLSFQIKQLEANKKSDFKKLSQEIKSQTKKEDLIFVTSELDFFTAKYYFPDNNVYIYSKSYEEIPDYVGKVLIAKTDIAHGPPSYPKRAFILNSNATYNIQALY